MISLFTSLLVAAAANITLTADNIPEVVSALTLEEKVRLIVGYSDGMAKAAGDVGINSRTQMGAAGATSPIERLGIPSIILADGPAGLRINPEREGENRTFYCTGFPIGTLLSSSWNTEMIREVGEAMGNEVLEYGVDILLAPGVNLHRNPLCGRNFEYYSEDPLISGMMAGYTSKGLAKYGVYAYAKHFALNEQEKNRENLYCWASEQAIREIYARGFEHYVNLGGLGLMTAFNKVGSYWAGASEALCTTLLREEWGFHGVVVTDYCYQSTMGANVGLRAQNDLWLLKNSTYGASYAYNQTPHDGLKLLRRASKNILYACAHSNNVWTLEDYQAVGIDEIIKATDRS